MASTSPAGHSRRSLIAVLLSVAVLTLAGLAVGQLPASLRPDRPSAASAAAIRLANAQTLGRELRLVNYYPRDRAWEQQWTRFSATDQAADFQLIRDLGATSVRIIVFPKVLGYPQPDSYEQAKLRSTLALADAAGLRVWLTLFDNFSNYPDLAGSRTWTTALLGPYAADDRIEAIEIRNEIKVGNPAAMTWAADQLDLIHQLLPQVPVTLSLNGSVEPTAYRTLLDALAPQVPDLLSYHYYGDPALAYDRLRRAIAAVGGIPLVIGEAGLTTAAVEGRCADRDCREAEQVDWFQLVVAAARQAGLATPAPWMVFDLTANATERKIVPAGYGYGVFRTDGSLKPAAAVLRDAYADRWTTAPQNTDFTETSMAGTRARGWIPWRPSGTFRVENGAGIEGAPALATAGTETLAEGVSSWYARPLEAVRPGQTWRAQVFVRGVNPTGRTSLSVAWYDGEGRYLGIDISRSELDPRLPGWQELAVTATPRPGAGAVRIHLRSAGNSGTAYFSKPSWTVTPG